MKYGMKAGICAQPRPFFPRCRLLRQKTHVEARCMTHKGKMFEHILLDKPRISTMSAVSFPSFISFSFLSFIDMFTYIRRNHVHWIEIDQIRSPFTNHVFLSLLIHSSHHFISSFLLLSFVSFPIPLIFFPFLLFNSILLLLFFSVLFNRLCYGLCYWL